MHYVRLTGLIIIALCAFSIQAQSGRRQTKPAPAAPVPTPTPEPTPIPKKAENEAEIGFFVGADRQTTTYSMPLTYYDAALRGCVDRLRRSSVSVDTTDLDLSRGDAIKKAKSESKRYVVLLSLDFDAMSRSYEDLQLEFVVFEPATAKAVLTGRSYQNAARKGPVIVSPPGRGSSSVLYREQMLRQAGEDAADRILKRLHLSIPAPRSSPYKAARSRLDTSHR